MSSDNTDNLIEKINKFHEHLSRGFDLGEIEWCEYRNLIRDYGIFKRLVENEELIRLLKPFLDKSSSQTINEMAKRMKEKDLYRKIRSAISAKDLHWLFEILDLNSISLSTSLKLQLCKLEETYIHINTLRANFKNSRVYGNYDFSEYDLNFAKQYMFRYEFEIVESDFVRKKMFSASKSIIAAIARDKFSKHNFTRILIQLWRNGLLSESWREIIEYCNRLEIDALWEKAFDSLSDKKMMEAWKYPRQLSLSLFDDTQKERLDQTIIRLGAVTRLKWIRKYISGQNLERDLAIYIEDSDLIFEY